MIFELPDWWSFTASKQFRGSHHQYPRHFIIIKNDSLTNIIFTKTIHIIFQNSTHEVLNFKGISKYPQLFSLSHPFFSSDDGAGTGANAYHVWRRREKESYHFLSVWLKTWRLTPTKLLQKSESFEQEEPSFTLVVSPHPHPPEGQHNEATLPQSDPCFKWFDFKVRIHKMLFKDFKPVICLMCT